MAKKEKIKAKAKDKNAEATDATKVKDSAERKPLSLAIIIPVIAVLVVVGSIAGTIVTNKFIAPLVVVGSEAPQATTHGKIGEEQVIVPMEEFLVNLAKGDNKKAEYMRITMSLLTSNEKDSLELTQNVAVVRDSVVNTLRQKTSGDILDTPESIASLKLELREVINNAYGKGIVGEVYITDFVIQ